MMTPTEAADILDVRPVTIGKWCRQGKLRAAKRGRYWEIDPASVAVVKAEMDAQPDPAKLDPAEVWAVYLEHNDTRKTGQHFGVGAEAIRLLLRDADYDMSRSAAAYRRRAKDAAAAEQRCPPSCPGRWADIDCLDPRFGPCLEAREGG